jgi:SET domain
MALFETTTPFPSYISVVSDPVKGRCLQLSTDAAAVASTGTTLFEEDAIVYSSVVDTDDSFSILQTHEVLLQRAFPATIVRQLPDIIQETAALSTCQSDDTAQNFILLLALSLLVSDPPVDIYPNYIQSMHLLDQLTCPRANHDAAIQDVKQLRQMYPSLIPKKRMNNASAGRLLSVLNSNQMELEQVGGSGLFVASAILEHSCQPNASFTTYGSKTTITAIRDIHPGERISIDYTNLFYSPTDERLEMLESTYGFRCTCDSCVGPDLKRAFKCGNAACRDGYVCPIGASPIRDFSPCYLCSWQSSPEYQAQCLADELQWTQSPVSSLQEVETMTSSSTLYRSHYLFFLAYDEIGIAMADEARRYKNPRLFKEALTVMYRSIELIDSGVVVPPVHHDKVVSYDRIAQLAVASGDIELAGSSYRRAWEMSRLCSGADHPATLSLQLLASNVPTTVEALQQFYAQAAEAASAAVAGSGSAKAGDDDDWMDA